MDRLFYIRETPYAHLERVGEMECLWCGRVHVCDCVFVCAFVCLCVFVCLFVLARVWVGFIFYFSSCFMLVYSVCWSWLGRSRRTRCFVCLAAGRKYGVSRGGGTARMAIGAP